MGVRKSEALCLTLVRLGCFQVYVHLGGGKGGRQGVRQGVRRDTKTVLARGRHHQSVNRKYPQIKSRKSSLRGGALRLTLHEPSRPAKGRRRKA